MRFLRRGASGPTETPEERSRREERAAESQRRVEAGGLPVEAEERIRRQGEQGGVFTSDLSVDELAALSGAGYEPVAQVLGSSLYRLSWISTGWGNPGMGSRLYYSMTAMRPEENRALTAALLEARSRALHRLVLEATGVRADGVVGVRLKISHWEWAQGMSEFTVLGTAVRRPGSKGLADPFTSTLSGQDLVKLLATGYEPRHLVMGASAQQAMAMLGRRLGGYSMWANVEIEPFSWALSQAQGLARQRIASEARRLGATGVVGVDIDSHVLEYPTGSESVMGRIVEWVMLGTAVAPQEGERHPAQPPPRLVVSLSSRRSADVGPTPA